MTAITTREVRTIKGPLTVACAICDAPIGEPCQANETHEVRAWHFKRRPKPISNTRENLRREAQR